MIPVHHAGPGAEGRCVECRQHAAITDAGLCIECLQAEVCCPNAQVARMSLCRCGGRAATELREIFERRAETA